MFFLENAFQKQNIFINGSVLPNQPLLEAIDALKDAELLVKDDVILAIKLADTDANAFNPVNYETLAGGSSDVAAA